ncbi:MAG: GGDEF domain-containing protein [Candidatus Campbellbacteria bacterium]|nr:GGDEF domain-containing protein [Candidatus Campbellbacteria bacterium]
MSEEKTTEKKISVQDLHQAVSYIKTLILDEEHLLDDTEHLKKILSQASVGFDAEKDHDVIEKLHSQLHYLRTMVYKDELTGILNRRGIHEEFTSFFEEAKFSEENKGKRTGVTIHDFSILFIDLDNFKNINDTLGHDAGDEILKKIGSILKADMRDTDAVGRFGGEEFVVAMLGTTEDDAYIKAEKIRAHIEGTLCLEPSACVTASIGVASLHTTKAETLERLITFADQAMYEAKTKRSKNNVVKYSELKK